MKKAPRKTKSRNWHVVAVKFWNKETATQNDAQNKPLFITSIVKGNPHWMMKTLAFYETHFDIWGRLREKAAVTMDYSHVERVEECTFTETFARQRKVTALAAMIYLVDGGRPLQILLEGFTTAMDALNLIPEPVRNKESNLELSAWLRKKLGDSKYFPISA